MYSGTNDLSACRIAVLEDSQATRLIVERLLQRHFNCQVSSHATAESLLSECLTQPPDIFLLDVVLDTKKSGIDVCREIRASEATRSVPVIFFSEHNQPQTRVDALRAGGADYVDKPFYPEEFLQRVRGQLERFLHQKKLEAQTQEQMALLRVLCHDLRNSVGASMTMLTQVVDADNDAERDAYLDVCRKATRSALDLIAHVGEYRSLLDGSSPLKMEAVNVAAACEEAINVIGTMAKVKGIKLQLNAPTNLDLFTNRVVLVHNLIINLLTNAIKFSRPGSTIWIEAGHETPTADLNCYIAVRDEGIGIPPHILQTLLQKRLVSSRPGTSREEGSGIGMTLVQLYVERCGGTVAIESQTADPARPELHTGTCVRLKFPISVVS